MVKLNLFQGEKAATDTITVSIQDLLNYAKEYFEIIDEIAFTTIFAVAIAHHLPGEMLWVRIYGGSRSGKTELLRPIAKHPESAEMEIITPAAIRGGLTTGKKLLDRIKGKLVITKDLAAILTSKPEARKELFGLLRNLKDGSITADYGTETGYLPQEGRFDWLVGTTPTFAQYRQMEDLLGARFIDLNWKSGNREEMALRALENNPRLVEIRQEFGDKVRDFIDAHKHNVRVNRLELSTDLKHTISGWADLTALLRSPVARDMHHRIKYHPEPEVGTDLAQGFGRITTALKYLDIEDVRPYIARLSHDSVPHSRRQAVISLLSGGLEEATIRGRAYYYEVEDMAELDIVCKNGSKWQIVPALYARIADLASWWDKC